MFSDNTAVHKAYEDRKYTDLEGNEWVKGMDGWFLIFENGSRCLVWHHHFVEKIEEEHPEGLQVN